ncbi:hypothetical protein Srubr_25810 [Streptomyces rubradiris]|uniref:Uncharacterized protein n=1 Tax=Streptomyces rubradiris TaxID=285531 RepID=A0ABQ3RA54_STRRR|nr:hypothetical protein [Streptomyces rubradiris]GHH25786.1 hypothetical protein GCM10018792_65300 [Streptomyces rubradiris]GHI52735.1 hypothetical protein Srubr_25810 [Streptomyces rubradiris]
MSTAATPTTTSSAAASCDGPGPDRSWGQSLAEQLDLQMSEVPRTADAFEHFFADL